MGLIGNNFRLNTGVKRTLGDVMSRTDGNAQRYSSFCNTRSQMGNTVVYSLISTPVGSNPETSFYPPQTAGGMALRSVSSGNLTANLISELLMSVDFTGSGDLDAIANLTVAMLCAMSGNGNLSADIVGVLNASVDFTGSGDLDADIKGIGDVTVSLLGSGSLDAAIAAYGDMSINITVTGTGLSTSNVGQYVWESLISQFSTNPDSAASKLLAAGSAGDPWSTILPAGYTGEQAGAIMDKIQTLVDELHKLRGANADFPATQTLTNLTAGDINIQVTGDGTTTTTFTRQP